MKRAREQLEALDPVATTAAKYDAALAERDATERERAAVRLFIAELRSSLLADEIDRLEAEGMRLWAEQDAAKERQRSLSDEREALIEERAVAGGDRIGELERLAREARRQAEERREARTLFDAALSDAGLEPIMRFRRLRGADVGSRPGTPEAHRREAEPWTAPAPRQSPARRSSSGDGTDVARNSPALRSAPATSQQNKLRCALRCAQDLRLTPDDLPYAGELLDVYEQHAEWRGAAERVLRGFALSLLVPQRHYDAVADWANARRLTVRGRGDRIVGARLTYERVPDRRLPLQPATDGTLLLSDCVEIREGLFQRVPCGGARQACRPPMRPDAGGLPQGAEGGHSRGPGPLGGAPRQGRPPPPR